MLFTSEIFLFVFFPLCVLSYALAIWLSNIKLMKRIRINDVCLILLSLFFYAWAGLDGIPAICVYILFVYIMGQAIFSLKNSRYKKIVLGVAVSCLIVVLLYYKYLGFSINILNRIIGTNFISPSILPMLGISFITFSAISYLVDIYRNDAKPKGLIDAALFIVFFPKVISGPIVLWKDFESQIETKKPTVNEFVYGLNRIMIGFSKKILIADFFGTTLDFIQNNAMPTGIDVPTAWLCTIFYTLQIYYDFSGYSDIAIGLSKLVGIDIKENFNFPYVSKSITEFWRRWHISLGTWFREYLYIPLGGNRKGKNRTLINLAIVFLITGIWHGAGFNYILWGAMHGMFMLIERCCKDKNAYIKTPNSIKWFATMFIVNIGWEMFRIGSRQELLEFFKIMLGMTTFEAPFFTWQYFLSIKIVAMLIVAILGATLLSRPTAQNLKIKINNSATCVAIKEIVLLALMAASIITMVSSTYSPFIYFQY